MNNFMIWITLFIVISRTCVPLKNLHFALTNLLLYKNVRKINKICLLIKYYIDKLVQLSNMFLAPLFCYKDVILEYICKKKNTLFCLEYVYG